LSARTSTIALLVAAGLGAGACGDDEKSQPAAATSPPAAQTTTAAPEPATTTAEPAARTTYEISKDRSLKPAIPKPTGDPPSELVTQDIVKGKGTGAKAGDAVTVDYVGVSHSTGKQFGAGGVIPGWDQGVVGMKKGGRRLLVIPPDLAYGAEGRPGSIAPNETLHFVIDLKKIG
jgi:peptidylprolyl isomerase